MPPKKKVTGLIKLQIKAGAATPAPPIGPALGQHGVNIMEFCKAYNAATEAQRGNVIPVEITVYEDRSFTFITKTPPAAVLIKQAIGLDKGSGEPNRNKVGKLNQAQLKAIAEARLTWAMSCQCACDDCQWFDKLILRHVGADATKGEGHAG